VNRSKRFGPACALTLLFVSTASAAYAQHHPIAVGVAYQLLDRDELIFPIGVDIDVSAGLTWGFAVVGEAGWSRNSSRQFGLRDITTPFHLAGGIRWSPDSHRRFGPYGQLLVGLEYERSDIERFGVDVASNALVQLGAGLRVQLTATKDLFGQIDWRHVAVDDSNRNAVRILIGVRLRGFR
jgi:hypothetical protein